MQDPRFTTKYSDNYQGPFFFRQNTFLLPSSVNEVYCRPGYQPVRPNKGVELTVNDYPFQAINYGGGLWKNYVYQYNPYK